MRRAEEFLVSHVRQRILTEHTLEASLGIWCLHEKLFITIDVDPSQFKMRINDYAKNDACDYTAVPGNKTEKLQ